MINKKINALVLDIDGVLTDGTVSVSGAVDKRVFLRDLDALTRCRENGLTVAFLTGEDEAAAEAVVRRCGGGPAIYGTKDKEKGIREIAALLKIDLRDICYIGDARRDVPAFRIVGLSMCPADGDRQARDAVDIVLELCGGRGAVADAVDILLDEESTKHGS